VILIASSLGAGLFGAAVSTIPSPSSTTLFWVGNFSAPWAVLPFIAGWAQRSWKTAALAGLLADLACVVGFYANFLTLDPRQLGLPASAPLTMLLWTTVSRWILFAAPWLLLAVAAGTLYGLIGAWWGRSRARLAGAALAAPFFAEPWIWPVYTGYYQGPLGVWVCEIIVGLAVLVWVGTLRRRMAVTALSSR